MGNSLASVTSRTAAVLPLGPTVVRPVPSNAVVLADGELGRWQKRNAAVTALHTVRQLREAGNLENLETVADGLSRPYRGRYPFLDTDVYKTLEGLAYVLAEGSPVEAELREFFEEAVDLIERAQAPDGYLNSAFQNPSYAGQPWSDLTWGHELYNLGHLIQAALAASRQLGDDRLLAVGRRFADLAVDRFGGDDVSDLCGHPEVEMALVELYRATGQESYRELARRFIDRRGYRTFSDPIMEPPYFQDAEPVRTLASVTGHAVRMGYLAAGATDVAVETGDAELLAAMERLFDDMVATKLHFTGGLGSRHSDEAIGDRFELPPDRSYSETCAAIAVMQWAWRLFLATGGARYVDAFEWVLYNAYAAGLSEDGTCFFYDNPLQRREDHHVPADARPLRQPWFICPCCPPNVVRWTAELQDYVVGETPDGLVIAGYTPATISAGGFVLGVTTAYPWAGTVRIEVLDAPSAPRSIQLRVPGWTAGAELAVNGVARPVDVGWATESRAWAPGDELVLTLPMPVRAHRAHPYLDAARGAAAIARGPLAYCVEGLDVEASVDDLLVDARGVERATVAPYRADGGLRTPHVSIGLEAAVAARPGAELYPLLRSGEPEPEAAQRCAVTLRPYFLWGNRRASAMRVWIRTE